MRRGAAIDLLERLHAAQNAFYAGGSGAELEQILTPDVTWTVPGASRLAGTYRGRREVLGYFRRRRELAGGTLRLHRRDVLVGEGDRLAALVDGSAVIAGASRAWSTVGLYDVAGGRIAGCRLLALDQSAFDAIWSLPAPDLPYLDEHAIRIAAPREAVWSALQRYVTASLGVAERHPLGRLLGTEPRSGFEVAESAPMERLRLAGRHRFARYVLAFDLTDAGQDATQLRAQSYAAFPGLRGGLYRASVVGTRAHVVATNHILRSVRRLSDEAG
jgi:ketosteroid isomerase-like protein